MLNFFLIYLICGAAIGFLGGLLGIGGGIIIIPVLLELFNQQGISSSIAMHMAVATSLAIVIPTSSAALFRHYQMKMIVFPLFKKIIPGLLFGVILGAIISSHLKAFYLERIFAIFLLFIAAQMVWPKKIAVNETPIRGKIIFIATFCIGTLSGMLGLGGGVLMVPYLNWRGIPLRNAIATATACVLPAAIIGTFSYMMIEADMTSHSWGLIYWPAFLGISIASMLFAPLGVQTAHKIPTRLLKIIFAILLVIVAIKILI